jgi:hypothetical protein
LQQGTELALTDMTGFSGFSSAARRAGLVSRKGNAKAEAEKIKATSTKAQAAYFLEQAGWANIWNAVLAGRRPSRS